MKRLIILGCLILGAILFCSSITNAQSAFKVGVGLVYGTDIEAVGVQPGVVYTFNEEFRGAGDVVIYFPDSPSGIDNSFWTVNANMHYLLISEEASFVYALGGINYATQKTSNGNIDFSNSEAGLNLGGGAEFGVEFGSIYLEGKYVLSDYDQLVLAGGVRFYL